MKTKWLVKWTKIRIVIGYAVFKCQNFLSLFLQVRFLFAIVKIYGVLCFSFLCYQCYYAGVEGRNYFYITILVTYSLVGFFDWRMFRESLLIWFGNRVCSVTYLVCGGSTLILVHMTPFMHVSRASHFHEIPNVGFYLVFCQCVGNVIVVSWSEF